MPAADLAGIADMDEIVARVRAVDAKDTGGKSAVEASEAEAVLGGAVPLSVTVSEAFDLYCEEIAIDELIGKSEMQTKLWRKTKLRGVQYFIDLVGDKPMREITRQDGLQYYNWWKDRLIDKPGRPSLSPNTANRDIGNVRVLFQAYFRHVGEEDRLNPCRNLSFKTKKVKGEVPPFEDNWVRSRILVPGLFAGVNDEAWHIIYALIETGCRPSAEAATSSPKKPEPPLRVHLCPHRREARTAAIFPEMYTDDGSRN